MKRSKPPVERSQSEDAPSTSQSARKKLKTNHGTSAGASSQGQSQRPVVYNSHPGVIKSLHLQNFMCHSNFTHEFHPNLNFITGQNGSGKSALLSGLLIALGGKASITSRTSSVKELIQKGKHTCRVSVTLLNKNGLKQYGDEITIEKWISLSGSSGYRVKSDGGTYGEPNQWKQVKKHEVENITLGLNIQIDNPIAILNQEVARSFLRSKDPKVKFNLFYDGTLLSKLETLVQEIHQNLSDTEIILSSQRNIIEGIRREVYQLKAKVEKIAELNKLRDTLKQLHAEYLWARVVEHEKALEEVSNKATKNNEEIEALVTRLQETEASLDGLDMQTILRQQEEARQKLREKKNQWNEIKQTVLQLKSNVTKLKMQIQTCTSTISSKESQVRKISAQIEKIKAEQDAKEKEESAREQERLNTLQAEKKELESTYKSIQGDSDSFRLAADKEQEKLENFDMNARQIKNQIENKRRGITQLSQSSNKYSIFGYKMEQLITKIQVNLHRFRKPPRGPLGSCFRVKDPTYAPLIEVILSKTLFSFVVDNGKDLALLKSYMDSIYNDNSSSQRQGGGRRPGIIMTSFAEQAYDYHRRLATHPTAKTLLELLEIENDDHIVLNVLLDVERVETVLLFKDTASAAAVLKDENNCPKTLRVGYTLQFYRFTPFPLYAARTMQQKSRAEILKSGRSKESEIESLKAEIAELENDLRGLEPRRAEIKEKEKSLRIMHNDKMNELTGMRRRIGMTANEIKSQQNKIAALDRRCDLTSFYEEEQELRDDLSQQTKMRDELTKQYEELSPNLLQHDTERKELNDEIEKLTNEVSSFDEDREKLKARRREVEELIRKMNARISALKEIKNTLSKEVDLKRNLVEEKIKMASEDGVKPRIKTVKTPAELRRDFDGLKDRIKETEAQLGNEDELRQRLKNRKEKFRFYMKDYAPLSRFFKLLKDMNQAQRTSFERTKEQMGNTMTFFFSALAKQRGYEGRLLVDFNTKELYYFVCPDGHSSSKTIKAIDAQQKHSGRGDEEQQKRNKQLKKALVEYSLGLSGGERSFATICFIMSLWQVMECPFYMLDEFDVFMDAFNRKTSQVALMAHAKKFKMNQFVLFTPLDLGEVPGPDEACVLRLFPPKRGNVNPGGVENQEGGGRQSDTSLENIDPEDITVAPPKANKPSKEGRKARKRFGEIQ